MSVSKRRPNRSHSAIDHLPEEIRLQIRDWHLIPNTTLSWISDQLREMGHKISISQLHRWLAKQRDAVERIQEFSERAQVLMKYLVPEGTNMEEAAVSLTKALFLEALSTADLQKVKSIEDLAKVANSLGRLQTSSVMRDRWEQERTKRIDAAVQQLNEEIKAVLEGKPELMKAILAAIDEAKRRMIEKSA